MLIITLLFSVLNKMDIKLDDRSPLEPTEKFASLNYPEKRHEILKVMTCIKNYTKYDNSGGYFSYMKSEDIRYRIIDDVLIHKPDSLFYAYFYFLYSHYGIEEQKEEIGRFFDHNFNKYKESYNVFFLLNSIEYCSFSLKIRDLHRFDSDYPNRINGDVYVHFHSYFHGEFKIE